MKDHTLSRTLIVVLLFIIAAHFTGLKTLLTILLLAMGIIVLIVLLAALVLTISAWIKYRLNRRLGDD